MSSEDICFAVLYNSFITSFDVLPSTSKITVGTQVILPSFVSLIESQISPIYGVYFGLFFLGIPDFIWFVTTTERNFTQREIGNLIVKYGLMILLLIGFWWYTTTQSCETKMEPKQEMESEIQGLKIECFTTIFICEKFWKLYLP
jgi:hypothetical protein